MSKPWVAALVGIGFTALEAEIYGALAVGEASTGYRVAQLVGKPAANVYKAIESLRAKGAVLVDDADTKRIRATPPRELVRLVGRDLDERKRNAATALAALPAAPVDRKIYELGTRAQVFERARTMLASSKRIALLDLGPGPLAELRTDLARAAARGVTVAARTEKLGEPIRGVELVEIQAHKTPGFEPWPGEWLTLVVDGTEHVLAVFAADGALHQAVWSNSAFLAWVFHSGLASEIGGDLVFQAFRAKSSRAALAAAFARLPALAPSDAPGRRALLSALRKPERSP
jgi:hypothetical protein